MNDLYEIVDELCIDLDIMAKDMIELEFQVTKAKILVAVLTFSNIVIMILCLFLVCTYL